MAAAALAVAIFASLKNEVLKLSLFFLFPVLWFACCFEISRAWDYI
jgi:hypothetical protein